MPKPTPTQEENDLAALGVHVHLKEWDGSKVDPAGPETEVPIPDVQSISGLAPATAEVGVSTPFSINGAGFTEACKVNIDGTEKPTTFISSTQVRSNITGSVEGPVDVFVTSERGDSNIVSFSITAAAKVSSKTKT